MEKLIISANGKRGGEHWLCVSGHSNILVVLIYRVSLYLS